MSDFSRSDRLVPEILTVSEKGQVLHRVRLHANVPGMSGGRENISLVSESLKSILKFSRMTFLIARFCGW